ncbi:succinate--CoA ligase subunit alpha [Niveispirillum fermenti]|uniref:succinate--CoA ligase subunit alpha n=1 Tax=Niveispirillum fermenti TaxID=1233113 RepID=UPI003A85863F
MHDAFITAGTPVIVQGITGRAGRTHTRHMLAYGTRIVGGVSPREEDVEGVPLFRDCASAVAATGAAASVAIVPPLSVLPAILEAVNAGIRTIVTLTEGMPIHDAVKAKAAVRSAGARWIGASTPGLAIPGRLKMGFLPDVSLAPGDLGVMSKSGTLSYEVCHRLVVRGMGQSLWVGVGGDPVKGTRFADLLPVFAADPGTRALVVIGEIGGDEEEELAAAIMAQGLAKPVYALIAGQSSREGVTMGHAGALIHGETGTVASKTRALTAAGARVFTRIGDLVDAVAGVRREGAAA